ncbi:MULTISPECIES: hypothetical protein [Ralstonia solanacearum species complex]|nr:hypothetical protein [Ralstonia solanacearum]YP_009226524.1 hypothetical protein AXI85_gp20 [Ralstonia phage RS138]YP_009226526.1 hypothetical protein AXI85_gp22 [Ralstonia phage RS138]BEU73997.1 hypothetical protein MAFF211271_35520 [Ralstonia pseudosolanacearum]BAS32818.1 hypothetical protein [Ralstonia phage RS138]BAS32820.1 hypothetical protein [Ralstonia phage RS138]
MTKQIIVMVATFASLIAIAVAGAIYEKRYHERNRNNRNSKGNKD